MTPFDYDFLRKILRQFPIAPADAEIGQHARHYGMKHLAKRPFRRLGRKPVNRILLDGAQWILVASWERHTLVSSRQHRS